MNTKSSNYAALLLRVSMGLLLLAHGLLLLAHGLLLKVMTFGIPGTVGFFQSIGYPGFLAYLVIFAEIVGGLALIAGFYTRWVSLAVLPVLLGATLQHLGNGWVFSAAGGGWEFPAFWSLALVVQALLGDGAYAWRPRFVEQVIAKQA